MINFIENSLFFGAALSLAGYEVGLLLKKKFKMALFNPLLIAILCVMGMLQLMQVDYKTYNAGGQYISNYQIFNLFFYIYALQTFPLL